MLFACIDMLCLCINIVLIFDFFVRCGDDDRITMVVDCRGRNRTIVNGRGNRNDRRWSCTQSDDSRWSWYPRSRSMTACALARDVKDFDAANTTVSTLELTNGTVGIQWAHASGCAPPPPSAPMIERAILCVRVWAAAASRAGLPPIATPPTICAP